VVDQVVSISLVYELSSIVGVLILILLIVASFLKGGLLKIVFTTLGTLTILLHYTIIYLVETSRSLNLIILPLLLVESTSKGSTIYPDVGQLILLGEIILWRNEIAGLIRKRAG
jgi:hypothetical protein